MKVSVAMATYNGERFIREQLDSILPQLSPQDEVVISDDGSTDRTVDIILEYANGDDRICLVKGPGKGAIFNFEHAIKRCSGDVIFLCDQDDVWLPGKVKTVLEKFDKTGAELILHNAAVVNEALEQMGTFFDIKKVESGVVRNMVKNSYMGCAMAFRSTLKKAVMPFPKGMPMHDQWIGLLAEIYGKVALIDEPLMLYRRHGGNVTGDTHAPLVTMLKWRVGIISAVVKRRLSLSKKEYIDVEH